MLPFNLLVDYWDMGLDVDSMMNLKEKTFDMVRGCLALNVISASATFKLDLTIIMIIPESAQVERC